MSGFEFIVISYLYQCAVNTKIHQLSRFSICVQSKIITLTLLFPSVIEMFSSLAVCTVCIFTVYYYCICLFVALDLSDAKTSA